MYLPAYIDLYYSGELEKRVISLKKILEDCTVCPHQCHVDRRIDNSGICQSFDHLTICSACAHHGEEPPLSGSNGSGTVFLGRCNLSCVYCQNADISQGNVHTPSNICSAADLARIMLELQNARHCHNINFVSPSHFVPQIVEAVYLAIPLGLELPLVYNSNGYDHPQTLALLENIIDIYLPDLKYADDRIAEKYSGIPDYSRTARRAIKEMFRQVGLLKTDRYGVATHGIIVRHLVLPGNLSGTAECLDWLARECSPQITLSLMAQYYPAHKAAEFPPLDQILSAREYHHALKLLKRLGFKNALYQEPRSAFHYRPDFKNKEEPFNQEP